MPAETLPSLTRSVLEDAMASRRLPLLGLTFVVVFGGAAVGFPLVHEAMAPEEPLDGTALLLAVERPVALVLAATGLFVGVAPRPVPRAVWQAPAGRLAACVLVGRCLTYLVALAMGVVTAGVAVWIIYDTPTILAIAIATPALVAFGWVFVTLGVALAVLAPTRLFAAAGAIGTIAVVATVVPGSPLLALETVLRTILPATPAPRTRLALAVGTLGAWLAVPLGAMFFTVVYRSGE